MYLKLAHSEISFCIDFDKTEIPVCIIESPKRWREIQKKLSTQYLGEDGEWVLSDHDKELNFSKTVEMIFNPLQLDENQRKLVTAFLKSFAEKAVNESHWRESQELNSIIQTFFGKMEMEYSFG